MGNGLCTLLNISKSYQDEALGRIFMNKGQIIKTILLGLLIALSGTSCAKKRKTFTPTGPSAPYVAPVAQPPAVNWSNPGTVNTIYNNPNLCYVSNTNYFAGQSYQTYAEPVYQVSYDYCSGYYRYYFQGYYYYFSPTGNCGSGGWGPPVISQPYYPTCNSGCY